LSKNLSRDDGSARFHISSQMRGIKALFLLVRSDMVYTPLCECMGCPNHSGESTHIDLTESPDLIGGRSEQILC
jgi:hypothetical protein